MKRLTPFKLAAFAAITLVPNLHADVLISEPFSGGAWADGSNVSNLDSSLNPSRVAYSANWFAYGLNGAGTVLTDYTSTAGQSLDTPNLSTTAGQGGGSGYFVTGNSNTSSRTFSFTATPIDRSAWSLGAITFYTKPNTNVATTQLAVEIGGSWYITTTAYTSVGGNATWTLQTINFDTSAGAWTNLLFDPGTNTLAAGSVLATPLPSGNIDAIGFYNVQNGGKVRIDTFIVNAAAIPEPSTLALAGMALLGGLLAIMRRRGSLRAS